MFAAGEVARCLDEGERGRGEQWVHGQRQGQAAAASKRGAACACTDVPFFWTRHQGGELRCSGYMAGWDEGGIDGDVHARDFTARYYRAGRLVAAASAGRDLENLSIEAGLPA